jgi:hypothetical protein
MAAQIDRQVSGNEFRSLVGRTRPFNGPSSYQPDRRQCSVCGRSIRRGELTLTASKPTFLKATGDAMNVSEALSSSHQLPQLAGPP